ncbi:hypothetical protein AMTRI_Chr08g203410 [Amborella trichopoda]
MHFVVHITLNLSSTYFLVQFSFSLLSHLCLFFSSRSMYFSFSISIEFSSLFLFILFMHFLIHFATLQDLSTDTKQEAKKDEVYNCSNTNTRGAIQPSLTCLFIFRRKCHYGHIWFVKISFQKENSYDMGLESYLPIPKHLLKHDYFV